jgi:hypothetical protein
MHGLQLQTLTGTWLQGRNRSVSEEQRSVHRERQSFRVKTSVFELIAQSSVFCAIQGIHSATNPVGLVYRDKLQVTHVRFVQLVRARCAPHLMCWFLNSRPVLSAEQGRSLGTGRHARRRLYVRASANSRAAHSSDLCASNFQRGIPSSIGAKCFGSSRKQRWWSAPSVRSGIHVYF